MGEGTQKCAVTVRGLKCVMFDRFVATDEATLKDAEANPEKKLYLTEDRGLCLPAENLYSFFASLNGISCIKRFGPQGNRQSDARRELAENFLAFVTIAPEEIVFRRKGKPVMLGKWDKGKTRDKQAGLYIFSIAPRVKKGNLFIPMPKRRPVLELPWSLSFEIEVRPNAAHIDAAKVEGWLMMGGPCIGVGTYRPRFGTFEVESFEVTSG